MTSTKAKPDLLPIGTRVTHFDGDPRYTHGKGTIVAYNGIEPNRYLQTNFKDAVEMAGEVGMLDALVSSAYDKYRCPYVVRFDINPRKADKYPRGYKDVYEHDSVHPLTPEENIFPSDDIQFMMRVWDLATGDGKSMKYPAWTDWTPITHDEYVRLVNRADQNVEFCVRPLQ